ncbi:carbohydrate-binding module family 50 protein [Xylariaceae sp. FL1272]|nr:carbohydrate-binding module family 50 protein [Xylariaceae sp. FL1272]
MADYTSASKPPTSRSTTALTPAGVDDPTTARPRNRRGPSHHSALTTADASSLQPGPGASSSRGVSPMPSARLSSTKLQSTGLASPVNAAFSRGLLEGSWATSWASVQDFASSIMDGGYSSEPSRPNSRDGSKPRPKSIWKGFGAQSLSRKASATWGPGAASNTRPAAGAIAAGSLAEREAKLMARKKASVLESHEGVNGGLDITGKYKRRNSDENQRSVSQPVIEEHLVYLHHVQPTDTYAGIVLRYRCMEHALRKMNGLWSHNIQMRKQLMIPVDACEQKGRPCDPPSEYSKKVDHLAKTPQPSDFSKLSKSTTDLNQPLHDDYFGSLNGRAAEQPGQTDEEKLWTHEPVEIVRVKRTATVSAFSSPRNSLDNAISNTSEVVESPGRIGSRRQSSQSTRPTAATIGSPGFTRSRVNSLGQRTDDLPAFMRKPGGVGSMGKSVKTPGPAKDAINSWVNKRLPGFNIDSLPSMSVMGSESAQFGFTTKTEEGSTNIVENPYEEGLEASMPARNGMGIEQAAASIETWLRGAWAKRPATPKMGSHRKPADDLDLIELTDTNSDDGRILSAPSRSPDRSLLSQGFTGTSSRRGRRRNTMPICIECRHPVRTLWTQYSGAGDAGSNIRLTVYRHLLHNTLMRDHDQFDPSIVRLGTLLLLFDVYLTWARIEKQIEPSSSSPANLGSLSQQPIILQYVFFLILCTFSTLAFHLSIRFLTSSSFSPLSFLGLLPTYTRPNSVSTALLVSSSTKLFPILMVIWDYDVPAAARSLGWAVVANNVEALKILLDCGYSVAVVLAAAGAVSRWLVGRGVLWCVGLQGVDSVTESGVAADGRALWALLGSAREWGERLAVG